MNHLHYQHQGFGPPLSQLQQQGAWDKEQEWEQEWKQEQAWEQEEIWQKQAQTQAQLAQRLGGFYQQQAAATQSGYGATASFGPCAHPGAPSLQTQPAGGYWAQDGVAVQSHAIHHGTLVGQSFDHHQPCSGPAVGHYSASQQPHHAGPTCTQQQVCTQQQSYTQQQQAYPQQQMCTQQPPYTHTAYTQQPIYTQQQMCTQQPAYTQQQALPMQQPGEDGRLRSVKELPTVFHPLFKFNFFNAVQVSGGLTCGGKAYDDNLTSFTCLFSAVRVLQCDLPIRHQPCDRSTYRYDCLKCWTAHAMHYGLQLGVRKGFSDFQSWQSMVHRFTLLIYAGSGETGVM